MSKAETKIVSQDRIYSLPQADDVITPVNVGYNTVFSSISKFLFKYGRKQHYNEGHFIIREGHFDKTVFIILIGEVEILKKDKNGNNKVVTRLTEGGTILGEMSIFLNEPRSSSVRISKETLALEFTGENFLKAVVNIPQLSMRILKSLSNKLKNTNDRVVQNNVCDSCSKRKSQNKINSIVDGQVESVTA